ncbi:sterol desaturase family protein [Nitratireductor pacificus]|uniref:Sterol desaturase-like protein n=1 Tax=Nitratireductor pacificus pht-3B TaxID=391937 RepID=K2N7W7_9HYPH|nr:sterol desaturase family protein [Nitratireductor pacificus]EKF20143.1 sterol desaturase-like protein [Nitratireductor pacificus pht-3B]
MSAFLFSEAAVRLAAFLGIFAAMAAFELWSPRLERPEMSGALKTRRWFANLSMVLISSLVLRVVFPAAAVGAAVWAEAQGWGLFHTLGLDPLIAGIVSFVLLDFAVWLEHVASHKIPVLWRIHRMHHADNGFDVTTGLRFHPLEILLSMLWKAGIVVLLGAPVLAVLIFEIVLNGSSMFNHSNVDLPRKVDRVLRHVLVTPDMHRVHHSTIPRETDSNYGFNFPFWDRLFGTYIDAPRLGHRAMEIGLSDYRGALTARLGWMLLLPFRALRRRGTKKGASAQ